MRWRDHGVGEKLLEVLIEDPDYAWLMIEVSPIKVHPPGAGARGGNQEMDPTKGGLNTKLHVAVDAHGMLVRVCITEGTIADGTQGRRLIKGIDAEYLRADKGYDNDYRGMAAKEHG